MTTPRWIAAACGGGLFILLALHGFDYDAALRDIGSGALALGGLMLLMLAIKHVSRR